MINNGSLIAKRCILDIPEEYIVVYAPFIGLILLTLELMLWHGRLTHQTLA